MAIGMSDIYGSNPFAENAATLRQYANPGTRQERNWAAPVAAFLSSYNQSKASGLEREREQFRMQEYSDRRLREDADMHMRNAAQMSAQGNAKGANEYIQNIMADNKYLSSMKDSLKFYNNPKDFAFTKIDPDTGAKVAMDFREMDKYTNLEDALRAGAAWYVEQPKLDETKWEKVTTYPRDAEGNVTGQGEIHYTEIGRPENRRFVGYAKPEDADKDTGGAGGSSAEKLRGLMTDAQKEVVASLIPELKAALRANPDYKGDKLNIFTPDDKGQYDTARISGQLGIYAPHMLPIFEAARTRADVLATQPGALPRESGQQAVQFAQEAVVEAPIRQQELEQLGRTRTGPDISVEQLLERQTQGAPPQVATNRRQAPPEAIAELRADPSPQAQQEFLEAFGYLPQGM